MILKFILSLFYVLNYVISVYKQSPIRLILIVLNCACTVTGHKFSPTCDVAF